MAELRWHADAVNDLDAIAEFIAVQSPEYAPFFVERLVRAVEHLLEHPQLGRVVPEIGDSSCREVIFQNYRIVYRVWDRDILIVGVIHAAMDMERQARGRDWELT